MGGGGLLIGVGAARAASGALLFGGSSKETLRPVALAAEAPAASDQGSLGQLLAGFSPAATARLVRGLERRVRLGPRDGQTLTLLGLAYQQRARETGDPAYYGLS